MRTRKMIIKIVILLFVAIASFYAGAQYAQSNVQSVTAPQGAATIQTPLDSPTLEPVLKPTPSPPPEKRLYKVTAYCPCARCCGKSDGITASGIHAQEGVTVAAGKGLSFGTQISIEGVGMRTVQDRGGAIKDNCLDLFFESHAEALEFGVQWLLVEVISK